MKEDPFFKYSHYDTKKLKHRFQTGPKTGLFSHLKIFNLKNLLFLFYQNRKEGPAKILI